MISGGNYRQLAGGSAVALSHTGDTNETLLTSVTIPPLGPNDQIAISALWQYPNSGNTKTLIVRFGTSSGVTGTVLASHASTTSLAMRWLVEGGNRNARNSQIWGTGGANVGTSPAANVVTALDTSVPTFINFTAQLASGAETITLAQYRVEIVRG